MTNQLSGSPETLRSISLPKPIIICVATIFTCMALVYMGRGFYYIVGDPRPAIPSDLHRRWQEQQYILKFQNPYDVRIRWLAEQSSLPVPESSHSAVADPELGIPSSGYAPWCYFTGAAFLWPSNWSWVRYVYGIISIASLVIIAIWAYRLGVPYGREVGWLFSSATLAMGSVSDALGSGQYGIIVLACLMLALWFDERGHQILCGLMLGISLLKPTMSLPFLVCFFMKGRWLSLAIAIIYTGVGCLVTWWLTGTDPLTMLNQMQAFSLQQWDFVGSQDLFTVLSPLGIDRGILMKTIAVGILIPACVLMFLWRRSSMLNQFMLAALAGRLFTYHRNYDNVILAFLLLSLAIVVFQRWDKHAFAWLVAVGVTLWLPPRFIDFSMAIVVLPIILVWIGAVAVVLRRVPRSNIIT